MELRILNYFLMVAREENITKAAQLLHVTQPTLSRQLMQLEEELGVKLFHRSNHSIVLTNEGMLLKRRAQEIVALADKAKKELIFDEDSLSGEIGIGCGELQSMGELSNILTGFREKHPLVTYNLYSGSSDGIKERLERGTLDLGLLLEPVDIGKYEFTRMRRKEEWGVLVPEESPLALKDHVHPEDLIGIPLLISSRNPILNELASWFGNYANQIEHVISYNLLYNSAIMVQKGAGVALCLKLDCKYDGLRFVPLSPKLELSSVLAWKEHQIFSQATTAFIQFANKYIQDISNDVI